MNKNKLMQWALMVPVLLWLAACGRDVVTMPKPKGYPRIDLPMHSYQPFETASCPFTFELPSFSRNDTVRTDSCWMSFYMNGLDCRWHVTYRHIPSSGKTRRQHFEEYHNLVYKHIQKSTRITETPIHTPVGDGMMYELYGTIGVPAQFIFGNDEHLVMTSFYFPTAVDGDSLSPLINFVKDDMRHLVETLTWK